MNKKVFFLLVSTIGFSACAPQRRGADSGVQAIGQKANRKIVFLLGDNMQELNSDKPGAEFSNGGKTMTTKVAPFKLQTTETGDIAGSHCGLLKEMSSPSFTLAAKDDSWKNIKIISTSKGENLGFAVRIAKVDQGAAGYPTYASDSCNLRFYVEYPQGSFLAEDIIPIDTQSGDEYHFWIGAKDTSSDFTLKIKPY